MCRVFVPGGGSAGEAWGRVTHLGVGAHPDDVEFMAFHGIEECRRAEGGFGAVVVTDGAGSVQRGDGAREDLIRERHREQIDAAVRAGYEVVAQLGLTSAAVRAGESEVLARELDEVFGWAGPRVVYTHNPADRHPTHVAVSLAVIAALRRLPAERRPQRVLGCEVWRDLDWLTPEDRVRLDCGSDEHFARSLNGVFRSQIEGGKRYDLAVTGRRRAQATFDDPHSADAAEMVTLAMDLTPLVVDEGLSVAAYVLGMVDRFRQDVAGRLP